MVSFTTLLLAAAPLLAVANPIDNSIDTRQSGNCIVNRQQIDSWSNGAQSRRRVAFSGEGTDVGAYCDYWPCHTYMRNLQCYFHEELDTWVLDIDVDHGALGSSIFNDCMVNSLKHWRTDTGCTTAGTQG